ncbi:MAG: hypothetical protein J6Y09_02360, partial [Lachnospiraceae bacterium]|nr:hypothetical protein [Lachnospiraceae bacterium]
MKKSLHKVLALVLAGAMLVGMTACGSQTGTTESTGTKTEETAPAKEAAEPAEEQAQVAGMDGWTKFDSQVTLKIPVYDRGGS